MFTKPDPIYTAYAEKEAKIEESLLTTKDILNRKSFKIGDVIDTADGLGYLKILDISISVSTRKEPIVMVKINWVLNDTSKSGQQELSLDTLLKQYLLP